MWPTRLQDIKDWASFRLDALGLASLLGATEVSNALGRLTHNRITEFLPLLASYVVANDQISDAIPGFTLYNITDAVVATDVCSWFSRWLLAQPLTYTSTTFQIAVDSERPKKTLVPLSVALGVTINGGKSSPEKHSIVSL